LANKKRTRELDRLRYKRDRVKRLALIQQREKRLRQMTPSWLSKDQRSEILEIYRNRPVGHQVDHIIPLKGQNVWGFHVPWNLQYLTAEENNRKSNNV
jgi:5-methylcytosine-specific restriction endonuclease McrA